MLRFALAVVLLTAFLPGCASSPTVDEEPPVPSAAQQVPPEAQRYIQMSREALATQMSVSQERIALESVTEPAAPDTVYVIKLVVDDTTYTYHGQEGRVSLVSSES